jgi:hypothetical protein
MMRKTIWTGLCGAIIGATTIAMAAQTSSTPQTSASASADKKITVTGCLKAAPSAATDTAAATAATAGTSGTAGTTGASTDAAKPETFVLTNATVSTQDATAAAGSSATSTASAPDAPKAAAPAQTYRLVANATALSPHVGKKLELTGTLQDEHGSPAAASDAASAMNGPALKVESGKVVAASCSE